jgi:dephospho-CoA kinase
LNKTPLRIGLTGGIASGKSMVADFFSALGAPVIDTDVIARQVVEPGAVALAEIRESFGDTIIKDDGSLDRQAMRKIVFADPDKRRRLEAILHPRIREATMLQVAGVTEPYMLIVVPLLVESPMLGLMDRVLVVDCSEATQLERLLARDSENEATARSIIAAQASREERLAKADDVVINDGDPDKAHKQVLKLHQSYLSLAAGKIARTP